MQKSAPNVTGTSMAYPVQDTEYPSTLTKALLKLKAVIFYFSYNEAFFPHIRLSAWLMTNRYHGNECRGGLVPHSRGPGIQGSSAGLRVLWSRLSWNKISRRILATSLFDFWFSGCTISLDICHSYRNIHFLPSLSSKIWAAVFHIHPASKLRGSLHILTELMKLEGTGLKRGLVIPFL